MEDIKSTILDRRSIRRYERESISQENMEFIYDAICNTPTSYNGQQFSVIDVADQSMKERLYEIIGQKQIKTCSHFLIFCADYNKISQIADAKLIEMPEFQNTADGVIVGVVDATLAMMNALIAAESCGLGTCPIGYARTAAPEALSRLLKLPPKVFVVCGLAIGVPREFPDLKPKQPKKLMIFSNEYPQESLVPDLLDYDETIKEYNATRSGTKTDNDWASHIISYYQEAMSYCTLNALRRRGFDIKR